MPPKIGLILDWQENGSFSSREHYALRVHFFNALHHVDALPIAIPYIDYLSDDYINEIDGILSPGGNFACPDDWYVDEHHSPYSYSPRFEFETNFMQRFLQTNKPVLAICAGMQLLGGIQGCKLTGNVHKHYDTNIDYLNEKPAEQEAYSVDVTQPSKLHDIVGVSSFDVNTAHQEALVEISDSIRVNATSPDGVIEGIEIIDHPFAIGTQWHPEFFTNDMQSAHYKIFKSFIDHAQN